MYNARTPLIEVLFLNTELYPGVQFVSQNANILSMRSDLKKIRKKVSFEIRIETFNVAEQ